MSDPNLNKFLAEVDEVSGVIQDLVRGTDGANAKADKLLSKNKRDAHVGFNSSRINKDTTERPAPQYEQSKELWMEEIANDAAKRASVRKKKKEESDVLKKRGNDKFVNGDFEEALDLYSEAIEIMKDNLPLWTNRAQVLIKMGKLEAAIEDCDFAFRIDEKCLKAFIHKSKALAMLGKFKEARCVLDEALERNPERKKTVSEYLQLVDEFEKNHRLRMRVDQAKELNSEELNTVKGVLLALTRVTEDPFFYVGCLNCMAAILRTEKDLAIFRSEDGFSILRNFHLKHFSSLRKVKILKVQDELQVSLACALIEVLTKLCSNCLPNLQEMSQKYTEGFGFLEKALESAVDAIQLAALDFMLQFSKADKFAQREFTKVLSWQRIVYVLCSDVLACCNKIQQLRLKIILLLVPHKEVLDTLQDSVVLSSHIAQALPNNDTKTVLTVLEILEHLYQRELLRKLLSKNLILFENLIKLCNNKWTDEINICALGIIFNTLHTNSDLVQSYYTELLDSSCSVSEMTCLSKTVIHARNFRVLRQISMSSPEKCEQIWRPIILTNIVHFLEQYNKCSGNSEILQHFCRHTTNLLAVLTKNVDQSYRVQYMEKFDVNGIVLMNFISVSSKTTEDFHCCANSALVLSFLIESNVNRRKFVTHHPEVCRELLSIASNHFNETVRGNVAIALSKLVRNDEEQLAQLRKLDGLKILHDCINFVK